VNWLDALARRLGTTPTRSRRFRPSLETLDRRDVPAVVVPTSSIGGYVYCDTDCDGVKDAGENGIAGVVINLTGTDAWGQSVSLSTTTDANGAYSFTQDEYGAALLPGTYTVTEVQPAGLTDGKDTQGEPVSGTVENDKFVNVNLGNQTTGVNAVNYNFGELCKPPPPSSLCGYVYVDCDNDGVRDYGEPGIGGVKITLTGTNATGPVTRYAYADSSGAYCFNDLLAGTYTLTETQPANYADGKDTQGTPGTGTVGNDVFSNIALAAGVNGKNNNFGELKPKLGSICGVVYVDCNNNGMYDYGDKGIQGAKVVLTGPNGATRTAYTDCYGKYCFDDLTAGTYKLTEYQPGGYYQGTNKAGSLGGSVSGDTITGIQVNGTDGKGYNFGEKTKYWC
jgi:SdrD B-like domain